MGFDKNIVRIRGGSDTSIIVWFCDEKLLRGSTMTTKIT